MLAAHLIELEMSRCGTDRSSRCRGNCVRNRRVPPGRVLLRCMSPVWHFCDITRRPRHVRFSSRSEAVVSQTSAEVRVWPNSDIVVAATAARIDEPDLESRRFELRSTEMSYRSKSVESRPNS